MSRIDPFMSSSFLVLVDHSLLPGNSDEAARDLRGFIEWVGRLAGEVVFVTDQVSVAERNQTRGLLQAANIPVELHDVDDALYQGPNKNNAGPALYVSSAVDALAVSAMEAGFRHILIDEELAGLGGEGIAPSLNALPRWLEEQQFLPLIEAAQLSARSRRVLLEAAGIVNRVEDTPSPASPEVPVLFSLTSEQYRRILSYCTPERQGERKDIPTFTWYGQHATQWEVTHELGPTDTEDQPSLAIKVRFPADWSHTDPIGAVGSRYNIYLELSGDRAVTVAYHERIDERDAQGKEHDWPELTDDLPYLPTEAELAQLLDQAEPPPSSGRTPVSRTAAHDSGYAVAAAAAEGVTIVPPPHLTPGRRPGPAPGGPAAAP